MYFNARLTTINSEVSMNIRTRFALVFVLCLMATLAMAQAPQSIKIYATDGVGSDSVLIGIHPLATGGIDAALGEFELPPKPPTFDFRCVTQSGSDNLGLGARINYHQLVRETQTDLYRLSFQSDDFGDAVTFHWQAGLASVGGGYWRMYETDGTTLLCDMTAQTSYTYHTMDNLPQYVIIRKGDGKGFLTASYMDLAGAVDYKNKEAAEKGKPYANEAKFVLTTPDSVVGLHTEFGSGIYEHLGLDFFNLPAADPTGKMKKFDYTLPPATPKLYKDTEVEIWVHGSGKKDLTLKKYWWIPAVKPDKWKPTKIELPTPTFSKLWVRMPNWNNVGQDIYGGPKGGSPPGGPDGIALGNPVAVGTNVKGKPIIRYIYHPAAWKSVLKTLNKKGTKHSTVPTECLINAGGKEVLKAFKGFPPDKYNNLLVAELLTLKFNAYQSDKGNTGTGFRSLHYLKQEGDPGAVPSETIIDTIIKWGDKYLTCEDARFTGPELTTLIHSINAIFAGEFDTTSYGGGKTIVKPARYLADVTMVYRPTLAEVAPVTGPGNAVIESEPLSYNLAQNYPNPFNPVTTIEFDLPKDAVVTLKVFNILGQEVATLINREEYSEGNNSVEFDASTLASGVYYYRLVVNDGEFTQVKKMMLIK
jgi:Secretion system C-terminal sorting domain